MLFEHIRSKQGIVFPVIHGTFGEDGELARLLENANITYIGSRSKALKLTIDKQETGDFLKSCGIRVPKSFLIREISEIGSIELKYPCIVKPKNEGSSVSLYRAHSKEELASVLEKELPARGEMLVQEYIRGREFTCGVVEINGKTLPLLPSEIILTQGETFDYSAKYSVGGCIEVTPADIRAPLREQIQALAKKVHELCGCRDISRTDMIYTTTGELVVLEINTIPGMTETSFIPAQLRAMGLSAGRLIESFLKKYRPRPKLRI